MSSGDPAASVLLRGQAILAEPLVRELLALRLVAVLATNGPHGFPHLTPLWVAQDGGTIVMATGSTSRKVANLSRDARASLVLHDSHAGFDVCGAAIEGTVETVEGDAAPPLVERVHRRYVDPAGDRIEDVAGFLASDDVALRLTPERAWTWDQRETPAALALAGAGLALPLAPTA
jgi:PPOX class probable F420-dependent enzyme